MQNRRNSIISKEQYQDGVRIGTILNINGRFPMRGLHSDCAKDIILYVMKGSGVLGHTKQKNGLSAGSVLRLENCESYYLKGQFSIYIMRV
jgi:hypothetical protein